MAELAVAMDAPDGQYRGDDRRLYTPGWDGNPQTWRRYKDEVRIWLLAERVEGVEYSLAARLVQRLSGAARRAALGLTDAELMGDPPRAAVTDADGEVITAAVPADGRAGG